MGIGVLGTLTVDEESARLGRRDRVVLTALAARAGQVVSQDLLADALWRDEPPASAHKIVHGCVSRLRRLLGRDAIQTAPPGYRLVIQDAVDSVRFEQAVSRARDLAAVGQFDRAGHLVGEALELWRGRPFPDVDDWAPAVVEATRLEELRREAEELRVDSYLRSGRHHEVVADAAALLREAPTREARWALLARAQYQDGRQAEALATLHQARELLAERLGIDPGPELDQLQEAVLRQDPQLLPEPADAGRSTERCPYRGLAAYDVGDAETFFGRDREIVTCLALLHEHGFLAVVGPSGSGKSSVVRAGVAAALSRAGTRVHVFTPGEAPVRVLDALPRRSVRDAWVVDQCEEAFSLCADAEQRREFLERLVGHAEQAPLVIALRADRLAELAPYPSFTRMVERGLHLLGAMDETALREVIEIPARQAGLLVEPGLVDLLVREVEGEPGALPLLSHALQETWLRREGNTLTVAGYQAAGGIRGAVAQTAEAVYGRVDPSLQHLVRELMLRLVSAGSAGEPSRIRAARSRVIVEPAQERLVDDLVAARLLTSEEGAIEIAHESLARAWPRLRDWLADDVEGQRILHHVTAAADAWDALGRPDSELYRGTRLQQALAWRDQVSVELTGLESEFLDAGQRAAQAEERALAERAREQARMIRRQRVALVAGSVLLVIALVAGTVALRAGERAQAGEAAAQASARSADAGRIGARSLTIEDPALSLLLAVEAIQLDDTAQNRIYLREAMSRRPSLIASTEKPERWMANIAPDPRGGAAVGYSIDNQVHRFDLETGELTATYDGDGPGRREADYLPSALAYSPDGTTLAVGSQPYDAPALVLLDSTTLKPLPDELPGLAERPRQCVSVAFSANGRWLAAAFVEPDSQRDPYQRVMAHVWDLDNLGTAPRVLELPGEKGWQRVQISDDGSTLYSGAPPAAYRVPTAPTPTSSASLPEERGAAGGPIWSRADYESQGPGYFTDLSPDGRWLAAPVARETDDSDALVVLDTRTGRQVARLRNAAFGRFSPDGRRLVVGRHGPVQVWQWPTGDLSREFDSFDAIYDFSADGSRILTAGYHGIETWDLEGDQQFMSFAPHPAAPVEFGWFSPRADFFASNEGKVLVVATDGSTPVRRVPVGDAGWEPTDWSPDGTDLLMGLENGSVATIPIDSPAVRRAQYIQVSRALITGLANTDDGQHLVVSDGDGWVRRVEADSARPAGAPVRVDGVATSLAATADGQRAFVLVTESAGAAEETARSETWAWLDLAEGRILKSGALPDPGDYDWVGADLDPSGSGRVAVFGALGVLVLDPTTGRQLNPMLAPHTSGIIDGRYTEDGSRIVAGGGDGRVSLWDGEGTLMDVAVVEPGVEVQPAMAPDGVTMLASTGDGFYRWDTRIGPALEAACRAAGRSMTETEWNTHVGEDVPYRTTCG